MSTIEEKRKSKRIPTLWEVTFSDGERSFTDFVRDMSTGGIQVESPVAFEIGTHLILSISPPPVKLRGIVRWCRKEGLKYAMGIQFLFEDPEQERAVRSRIHSMFWDYAKAR